jgi:hypothetical protein
VKEHDVKKIEDTDARTLDIVTHEVGLLEMQEGRSTADDRRWAHDVASQMRARIAEYRRNRLPRRCRSRRPARSARA